MSVSASQIELVRAFNRNYTRRLGLLQRGLYDSPYSLTELRVIYEIALRRGVTAAELAEELDLDRGYLSRILKRFTIDKLLSQHVATKDARRRHLQLTSAGRKRFAKLNQKSQLQVTEMLSTLDEAGLQSVINGMQAIESAFSHQFNPAEIILRSHRPGDMGWVVARHGELYAEEQGWDERFEALVAQIVAEFIDKLDPKREACWIAERNGQRLGSVFLVAKDNVTAKLRLLLVDPAARGCGLGSRLVNECVQFARDAGYRKVVLWTQNNLSAARRIYSRVGFQKIAEEPHDNFGPNLIDETWSLDFDSVGAGLKC